MRLIILAALVFAFGVLVLVGFLRLVHELLIEDFFHPPSMPGDVPIKESSAPTGAAREFAGGKSR